MYVCLMNEKKERLCFSEEPMTWRLRNVNTKRSELALSLPCVHDQLSGVLHTESAFGLAVKNKPRVCETDKIKPCIVNFCIRRMWPHWEITPPN